MASHAAAPRLARGRAQALVEFAIALPLFLLLMMALVDFSRLLYTYIALANGVRETARTASISGSGLTTSQLSTLDDSVRASFNQYTVIGGAFSSSDLVVVCVVNQAVWSAHVGDTSAICPRPPSGTSSGTAGTVQTMTGSPLSTNETLQWVKCAPQLTSSCNLPSRVSAGDGYVEVSVAHYFAMNPLFDAMYRVVTTVTSAQLAPVLLTTSRSYVE